MEKRLEDAIKAYTKGKKVVVLQELEDGSLHSCTMEDYIDDKTHFLVDVPAAENPDWNKAMYEMIVGSSQQPEETDTEQSKLEEPQLEEPRQEDPNNFSGGATPSVPEELKENKFDVVKDLTRQGKSAKEIVEITGYSKNLVYQYQYKIRQGQQEGPQTVAPGHNADRHLCKTCKWRSTDNNIKSGANGCEYSIRHNHSRGCKVEDCNVYEKGNPKKNIKPHTL